MNRIHIPPTEVLAYTEDGDTWLVRYHHGSSIDAMQACQRWAEDESLAYSWAEASEMIESIYAIWELRMRQEGKV